MFTKHINLLSEITQGVPSRHHRNYEPFLRSESRSNSNPRNQSGALMNTAVTNVFSQHTGQLLKNGSAKSFTNMPL